MSKSQDARVRVLRCSDCSWFRADAGRKTIGRCEVPIPPWVVNLRHSYNGTTNEIWLGRGARLAKRCALFDRAESES